MKKCRICLEMKKNLCSVFVEDGGISFADMLKSIANVKIVEDSYKNNICLQCRRKLRNLYNFKKEIERSEFELNKQMNILKFNNIQEIKAQLIEETKVKKKNTTVDIDFKIDYTTLREDDCRCILYRNTTITKIGPYKNCIDTYNIDNIDLGCKVIDYETENDLDIFYDDWDYEPLRKKKIRKKVKKDKEKDERKLKKYSSGLKKVCIKPIYLEDIRVIPTKPLKKSIMRNDHKRAKRSDMCPHCGKMYTNMKSHILVHIGERKYKCSECNKAFYTSKLLRSHQNIHWTSRAYQCDHCVAVFNNKASLRSHMTIHIDVKNHVCPSCNKCFKRKNALLRHKLIHNSSAKSIKCDLCNMTFLRNQGLRHHMRVHTGERPFKCEICSQPYSYKHDFNRHCLKKHGVFLKRRAVYVMNEEVLKQERSLMKELSLRVQGVVKDGKPMNPFKGPSAALAFNAAVEALVSCQIPIDSVL